MRRLLLVVVLATACQSVEEKKAPPTGSGSGSATEPRVAEKPIRPPVAQVQPPIDIKAPPADAIKTSTGLIYKKLDAADGIEISRNDTVQIVYTGWKQSTGETFFSNKGQKPMALPLANTAAGFTEAMQLMKKGERSMLWLPPSIGYTGAPPKGAENETLVYEVEVIDVAKAPVPPLALKTAPVSAKKLASGTAYEIVKTGTGTTKPHSWDTVTFNYTAWESDGRMFDSTEMRSRPATVPVYKQSSAMEEMLSSMLPGSRVRFWVESKAMQANNKPIAGMPDGLLTYEIELMTIQPGHAPPPVPPDLAGPPANAKKSPKGVAYIVLKAGKGGPKPTIDQDIKVAYTGWTQDKRVFDSTVIKGAPADLPMNGVIVGWQDTLPLMSVGDKWRLWVPDELAYAGAPNRPQGMLVTDVELLAIKERPKGEGGVPAPSAIPAPEDVATPPADAKKTPRGVFYKITKAVPNAPKPTANDTIRADYTGWQTNGQMFETSKGKGPMTFKLPKTIDGWKDAFPVVGVGESARFWVPEALAYPAGDGPKGMLVFDVDLIEIVK